MTDVHIDDAQTDAIDTTEHKLLVNTSCTCGQWLSTWPGIGGIAEGFAEHLLWSHGLLVDPRAAHAE